MELFLLTITVVAISIIAISVKMFLKPGGMFTRKCSNSFDPATGKYSKCTCENKKPEDCKKPS